MKPKKLLYILFGSISIFVLIIFMLLLGKTINHEKVSGKNSETTEEETTTQDPFLTSDAITVDYLPINDYSRSGKELEEVNSIVIHYVGNPGTTAAQNRSYFESLMTTHTTSASSHYIVGLSGEIIQCVPLDEISYASNNRNSDTIAIECCHPDETGEFNQDTYQAAIKLTAALCDTYGLDPMSDVIRHYDVTGKKCPLYYVDNEDAWYEFKINVQQAMNN